MKKLNLVNEAKSEISYKISRFPDGQQNITINSVYNRELLSEVLIYTRLNSFTDLEILICATQALREMGAGVIAVHIPYFLGSRSDRKFEQGSVNYLKQVICPIINSQNYNQIIVLDPHSDVLEACLKNYDKIDNHSIVKNALTDIDNKNDAPYRTAIVSPDAGALKKIFDIAQKFGIEKVVTAGKVRDMKSGKILKTELPTTDWTGIQQVVIIDDICDGGRTFTELAKAIRESGFEGKIFLIVTHGIFSAGFDLLNECFDGIYSTNSVKDIENPKLTQFNVF